MPLSARAGDRVALVIANSAYKYLPPLRSAESDARAVNDALEAVGFQSEILRDANADALAGALRNFSRRAGRADEALLYYIGYSAEAAKAGYLLPTDADSEDLRDPAAAQLPSMETLLASFAGAHAVKLVVVDAVRVDPNAGIAVASGGRSAVRGGLGRLLGADAGAADAEKSDGPDRGGLIVYSTSELTTAPGAQDPFTASFLRHLRDPDGSAVDVFRKVNDELAGAARGPHKVHIFDFLSQPYRFLR